MASPITVDIMASLLCGKNIVQPSTRRRHQVIDGLIAPLMIDHGIGVIAHGTGVIDHVLGHQ
jgi:hypothetical protein